MTFEKNTLEDEDYHEENVEGSGQSDVHKYFLNLEKMKKEKRRALEKDLEEQENSGGGSEELVKQNNAEGKKMQESAKQGHKNNQLMRSKEDTKKETNKIEYSDEIKEEEIVNEPPMKWSKHSKSQGTQTDFECDSNEDCYNQSKEREHNTKNSNDRHMKFTTNPSVKENQEETHKEYLPIDHKSNLSVSDKQSSLKSFDSLLLNELWKLRKVFSSCPMYKNSPCLFFRNSKMVDKGESRTYISEDCSSPPWNVSVAGG